MNRKAYHRAYYRANKDRLLKQHQAYVESDQGRDTTRKYKRERSRRGYRKHTAFLADIKIDAGCADCGYKEHSCALQFHHLDPSTKTVRSINDMWNRSRAAIQAEIAKCIVLCANCHSVRHCSDGDES